MHKEALEITELLAKNERALRDLYAVFAVKFADLKDFWTRISAEEESHARAIETFAEAMEKGVMYIDVKRFKKPAIELNTQYINRKMTETRDYYFSDYKAALILSLELENTLIEKKFFEICEADTAELKFLLDFLRESTLEHIKRVQEERAKF